uniref:Transcription factor WRKY24-like n=1 Tax=Lolium perenne TaxID=4522 RepID=A0A516UX90_LOLPR|nr:transcription factor WRKY24-like [Lolium perenne]
MASSSHLITPGSGGGGQGHGDEQDQQAPSPEEAGAGEQLVMPEDGYQWKKYGQKFIKNIQKIRSYFRCRDKRCGAKKKVEWHPGDPSLRIVYDGAHQHGSPSSTGGQGEGNGEGVGNRYELSAQYFGGAPAQ